MFPIGTVVAFQQIDRQGDQVKKNVTYGSEIQIGIIAEQRVFRHNVIYIMKDGRQTLGSLSRCISKPSER